MAALPPPTLHASPPPVPPGLVPPGWFADPWRAATWRWWDGYRWTPYTNTPAPPHEPLPTLPFVAGLLVLGVLAASIVADRSLASASFTADWPNWLLITLSVATGYGPPLATALYALHRWGQGRGRDAVGLRIRPIDLAWGPAAWLAIYLGNIVLAIVISVTKLPITSNVRGVGRAGPAHSLVGSFVLLAIVAPLIEELLFRGVVLRALRSKMAFVPAVLLQGVCFGAAHVNLAFGTGNLGLVLVLAWVGTAFGCVSLWVGRLAPTMIAHALFNTVVFLVIWLAPSVIR